MYHQQTAAFFFVVQSTVFLSVRLPEAWKTMHVIISGNNARNAMQILESGESFVPLEEHDSSLLGPMGPHSSDHDVNLKNDTLLFAIPKLLIFTFWRRGLVLMDFWRACVGGSRQEW